MPNLLFILLFHDAFKKVRAIAVNVRPRALILVVITNTKLIIGLFFFKNKDTGFTKK